MNSPADTSETKTRRFARDIRRATLCRALFNGALVACALAAACTLVARAIAPDTRRLALALCALAGGIAVCIVSTVAALLRKLPSPQKLLAAIEANDDAGGLLMTRAFPGAERWTAPDSAAPAVAFRPRGAELAALACAALAAAVAILLPQSVFRRITPTPPVTTGLETLAQVQEEKFDALSELGALSEKERDELREWLDEIENGADALSPAATLEALDHVAETLDAKTDKLMQGAESLAKALAALEPGDSAAENMQNALDALKSASPAEMKAMADALADALKCPALTNLLSKEELMKLAQDAAAACSACNSNKLEQLQNMCSNACSNAGCNSCSNAAAALSELAGASGGDNKGDAASGPAHGEAEPVPVTWADFDPDEGNTAFADESVAAKIAGAPDDAESKGFSAVNPDVPDEASEVRSGTLSPAGSGDPAAGGAHSVLPRHRSAVRNYFGDQQ